MRHLTFAVAAVLSLVLGCAVFAQAPEGSNYNIQVGAQRRSYSLSRFKTDQAQGRLPILIFLHGLGTRVTEGVPARFDIPFATVPDMEAALIVRPQGVNRTWDLAPGRVDTWRRLSDSDGEPVDDIGFLRSLIAQLVERENGDPARVYVAGVSAGGYMAARVACELGDKVTAVADVIATARAVQFRNCSDGRSVPFLLLASTTDPANPYGGQKGDELTELASAPETVAFFVKRNGCKTRTEEPILHLDSSVDSTATLTQYSDCSDNADVLFYRIDGSGHSVPSKAPPEAGSWTASGARNRDIETTQALWLFFQAHRSTAASVSR